MKLSFIYNQEKDIWCLLNKGKSSNNSPLPTNVYTKLITAVGENPDEASAATFIEKYLAENGYDVNRYISSYQNEFEKISDSFKRVAENVFGVILDKEIAAYLTINSRCPYNIEENWFFVPISKSSPIKTIIHELWHFYTWYKFGIAWEEKLGKGKYNDMKEALTVLLNVECKHVLPEGVEDKGYPQHKELRDRILELWKQNPDIDYVWTTITK